MRTFDVIVIGGGVMGTSVAFHLARLGTTRVLLVERSGIGGGTTAQSSGILRSHYSVPSNVELAADSWHAFRDFAAYVGDEEASAGLVRCGYLIAAPEGPASDALADTVAAQRARGLAVHVIGRREGEALLPLADLGDAALVAHEPEAGFADPTMVAAAFARAARRAGVQVVENCAVRGLVRDGDRVVGVETAGETFGCSTVVAVLGIWSSQLTRWAGIELPIVPERHRVLALRGPRPYTRDMPVFKDLGSPGMLYCRSYGNRDMLVSEGLPGEPLAEADTAPGDVPLDTVAAIGEQVAVRFPSFAEAGLASAWTGVYDVTPDWNPILGRPDGVRGLVVGCGFSGHGFKLSPAVGRLLAQEALGLSTDRSLAPYAAERFATGRALVGRYGHGAVS